MQWEKSGRETHRQHDCFEWGVSRFLAEADAKTGGQHDVNDALHAVAAQLCSSLEATYSFLNPCPCLQTCQAAQTTLTVISIIYEAFRGLYSWPTLARDSHMLSS